MTRYGLYDDCTYDAGLLRQRQALRSRLAAFAPLDSLPELEVGGATNDYVCGGGLAQRLWTDAPATRKHTYCIQ